MTWDRQTTDSLLVNRVGKEYAIPNLDDSDFYVQTVLEQQEMRAQLIFKEWKQAR